MKTQPFFNHRLIAFAICTLCFAMAANAQSKGNNGRGNANNNGGLKQEPGQINSADLALVSCKTWWTSDGQVQVEWTVRNDGKGACPLTDQGNSLVTYTVDGTKDRNANANAGNWQQLQDSSPLICEKEQLKPGETATGTFTFESTKESGLVSYRVSLSCGNWDQKPQNNVYVGLIGK